MLVFIFLSFLSKITLFVKLLSVCVFKRKVILIKLILSQMGDTDHIKAIEDLLKRQQKYELQLKMDDLSVKRAMNLFERDEI